MMSDSKINWLDAPGWKPRGWPIVRGCTKASAGCLHCYAERYHHRFQALRGYAPFEVVEPLWLKLQEPPPAVMLPDPLRWQAPSMVFVCPSSDLFHPMVPFTFIDRAFDIMRRATKHRFLLLTKRAERMARYSDRVGRFNWPSNVWAGVTVENNTNLERLIYLLETPAPVKFVSMEPLLEKIDLAYLTMLLYDTRVGRRLDWMIVGAESGKDARPMPDEWVESLATFADLRNIPLFYKQQRVGKRMIHAPELDGQRRISWPRQLS